MAFSALTRGDIYTNSLILVVNLLLFRYNLERKASLGGGRRRLPGDESSGKLVLELPQTAIKDGADSGKKLRKVVMAVSPAMSVR